jgi:hypothetical protein
MLILRRSLQQNPMSTSPSTTMKPRWIDWLAAAAIAFTLSAGAATAVIDDLPRIAQSR